MKTSRVTLSIYERGPLDGEISHGHAASDECRSMQSYYVMAVLLGGVGGGQPEELQLVSFFLAEIFA